MGMPASGTPGGFDFRGGVLRGGEVARGLNPAGVADWLAGLRVTQGPDAGNPLRLLEWEREFLFRALQPGVRQAALSVARGNGKTTLIAGLAAAAIAGPLRQPRAEVVIVAASYSQARIAFEHVHAFLQERLVPRSLWRVMSNQLGSMIEHRPSGARLRLLSSDPKRAHGIAPFMVIADEPAQWTTGTGERMYSALLTSLGKVTNSRLIALGTRPARREHWFQRLLDSDGESGIAAVCHAAGPDDDIHAPETWLSANPSLPAMPELADTIRAESEAARKNPALGAAFRALRLNLGTPDSLDRECLIDIDVWRECCDHATERRGRYVLGVDLGGSLAISAAVACWPATGRLEALSQVGDNPDLDRRGSIDGVGELYSQAFYHGELGVNPGRVADVGALLGRVRDTWGAPGVIVCDRWRLAELRDTLDRMDWGRLPVMPRGQGYQDGNADVRRFREAVAERRVHPAALYLLLEAGVADATLVADPAGNIKLAKSTEGGRRGRARDDVAAAAILAVAHADRISKREAPGARRAVAFPA